MSDERNDDNVILMPGYTRLHVPVERVLDAARDELTCVILAGHDKDGEEYFATSGTDKTEVLWLLERMKHIVLHEWE